MDSIQQQIVTAIVGTIGGIDILGIIGLIVVLIRQRVKIKKEIAITKQCVEDGFKNAILPKNIKLDVSNKIEKPIREGLTDIKLYLQTNLERIEKGEQLILSILSLFSHVKQLPEDVQTQIDDYLEANISDEVKLD